jgi:hypothetical protein
MITKMSDEHMLTYTMIPNTTNIISSMIENINNDSLFKKHVTKLSSSEKVQSQKKGRLINETIQNIRVFNTAQKPLFLAKDIGILMGVSSILMTVKKFDADEKIDGMIKINNKQKKMVYLTKMGVYRCFYQGRSPLAKLFRSFIANLIDHMVTHEAELLKKISEKFQVDNVDLIEGCVDDMHARLVAYKDQVDLLELQVDTEQKLRCDAENDVQVVEAAQSFDRMQIEQLRHEKSIILNKLNDPIVDADDADTDDTQLLKKIYMKPMFVYIQQPEYFIKKLNSLKKSINATADKTETEKRSLDRIGTLLEDMDEYERNFLDIETHPAGLDMDELMYFSTSFARIIPSKFLCVKIVYVANTIHYKRVLESLAAGSETMLLGKTQFFRTTMEDISFTVNEEFRTMHGSA